MPVLGHVTWPYPDLLSFRRLSEGLGPVTRPVADCQTGTHHLAASRPVTHPECITSFGTRHPSGSRAGDSYTSGCRSQYRSQNCHRSGCHYGDQDPSPFGGRLPAWDPSPSHIQTRHPSGARHTIWDPSPAVPGPIIRLEAVQATTTRRRPFPVPFPEKSFVRKLLR